MVRSRCWLWVLGAVMLLGILGCGGGGGSSSDGGSGSTSANPLVGTWRNTGGAGGITMTFKSDGTGTISDGHTFRNWRLEGDFLSLTIDPNYDEKFKIVWNSDKTGFTMINQSASAETTTWVRA